MKKNIVFLYILLLIFVAYSNTFESSWHLDDEPNIWANSNLQISELTFTQLRQAMSAHPSSPESRKLYRPLPCLTFGLNWYFGQDNVWGYHAVNIAIHILTAWLLFLTLRLLLRLHYQEQEDSKSIEAAALLGALFWALAPIQTQAVTYIVQRMASMAAMFGIASIYAYLRGRAAASRKFRWFLLCLLAFFAALGSKENAILLLPSLILVEFSFFRHHITKRQLMGYTLAATLMLTAAAVFVRYGMGLAPFSFSNPLSFLDDYSNRSFTFSQRILTQPRILLMYISQIFLPIANRLSIEHEIALSASLFSPWTTLPSIAAILGMIGGSLFFLKKYPLICFPVLFYFLNHAVESTILQLELVFEHRNYLPSLFLFLPLGVLIAHILHGSNRQPAFRRAAAAACATLFLMVSGHATYTRNMAWATDETLWTDAIKKAPNSARAAHSLGSWYRKFGLYEVAYHYYKRALLNADKAPDPQFMKKAALNEAGSIPYLLGRYQESLKYFSECLNIDEKDEACLKNRALNYLQLDLHKKALEDAVRLSMLYPADEYKYIAAKAAYFDGQYKFSLNIISKIAGNSMHSKPIMHLIGILMIQEKAYLNSIFFLKQLNRIPPNDVGYQLLLAAAYNASKQSESAKIILNDIFETYPIPAIAAAITNFHQNKLEISSFNFIKERFDNFVKVNIIHENQPGKP